MDRLPQRPIKRMLVANRGEIATRVISSARELDIETYAIYMSGDAAHAVRASHGIELPSAAAFMSIDSLVSIVKRHHIDAVHPGYGFLSESPEFAKRMWDEASAVVVGPGWRILESTGDKLKARQLAEQCNVPVSPALLSPTNSVEDIRCFASQVGYPIMVKAVDGGGGRGIRLIQSEDQLVSSVKRAVEESPSKQVFAEKAAIDGFRHIEVQIIGDGTGDATHLWERECSIQRRYQKVVELAPSVVFNRKLIARVIEDALRIAKEVQYFSLGTFEFLVNPATEEYYFLEVNPRLQVEHTITESICMTDIVKAQLLISQGARLDECGLPRASRNPAIPPPAYSVQLRITAENVQSDWSLSIGRITSFQFPTGHGIRVDTHLLASSPTVVSTHFDSLLAKVIVTASSWSAAVKKAQHALADTHITGVKTNIGILRGIIAHPDFLARKCDTQWLESNQAELLQSGLDIGAALKIPDNPADASSSALVTTATTLFRKGDAWSLTVSPYQAEARVVPHHLSLTRVLRNDFPSSLAAEILFTTPPTANSSAQSVPYTITLASTSASAAAAISHHRRGDPSDPTHVSVPFSGKLVEVLVGEGDIVREGDTICVIQQMKMELEVRSPRSGIVTWVMEAEDEEDVAEGMLAVVIVAEHSARL